jgi:predicted anti-sigma-YlaC factor YlaD
VSWELSAPIFALVDMECDRAREGISARIDGEDPGLPGDALDAHLAACAPCRSWGNAAHTVTRRAKIGAACLDHDLTAPVLAAAPPAQAGWRHRMSVLLFGQARTAGGGNGTKAVA